MTRKTRTLTPKNLSAKPASAPKIAQPRIVAKESTLPVGTLTAAHSIPEPAEIDTAATYANRRNRLVNAVKFGRDMWRLEARFKDLRVHAVSAIGTPGCLDGPELSSRIDLSPEVQTLTGIEAEIYEAVRDGYCECFEAWRFGVTVPGLPWYPSFAAFPGPQAPPTPNIPTPLIACTSANLNRMGPADLKDAMIAALRLELRTDSTRALVSELASLFTIDHLVWIASQMVSMVLGKGPVPTFAPPYVPVGPVVMGDVISTPGHLAG
jgi:hypothetical protein